jgi:hypothetical protein
LNLKKIFLIELTTGIMLYLLFVFWLARIPAVWSFTTGNIIGFVLILIYNQIIYRKPKEGNEENYLILKRTSFIIAIVFGIPVVIFGMNVKNQQTDLYKHVLHYVGYYWLIFFLIVHSLAGLAVHKYYSYRKMKENAE